MTTWFNFIARKRSQVSMGFILSTAIIVMGVIWIVFEQNVMKQQAIEMYTQQAEMIGATTKPAMMFNDIRMALELVSTLKTNKKISSILIFGSNGDLLANVQDGKASDINLEGVRSYIQEPVVEGNVFKIGLPVMHKKSEVGHIYVEFSLDTLFKQQTANIINILLIIFITWILSFAFTNRLQLRLAESQARLRRTTKEAKSANRAKSEFLSTMSHELRTPIHGIIGLQDLIASDCNNLTEEQRESLMLAQQSAKSLRSLVNDVLDLAKIESGNMELIKETFDLSQCVNDALVPFILTAREKGLSFKLEMSNVPASMIGDESRLRQVLLNLVGNAIKFTERGHVLVNVIGKETQIFFSIEDSGVGIPPEQMSNIFEPFIQAPSTKQSHLQGTGLGTNIAKRFVELMEGTIHLESTAGKGSCFTFQIPCDAANGDKITKSIDILAGNLNNASTEAGTTPPQPESSIKALLAEDDPIGQRIAMKQLSRAGIEVDTVDNGISAWETIKGSDHTLLLTDIRMPGLDGIELTRRIRALEKETGKPRITIIGLSAHALEEVAKECKEAGMDDFMTKPVSPEMILSTILAAHPKEK